MIGARRLVQASALCALAAVSAACGGGGSSHPTSQVPRSELAAMVLPKSAFGGPAAALRINAVSGFLSNAKAANGDLDPRMTTVSLARAGRLSGYARTFRGTLSRFESAIEAGGGLLVLGSDVDLFRDDRGAEGQLRRSVDDLRALVGKRLKGGATLVRGATFSPAKIGDAATGERFEIRIKGISIYITQVGFRHGDLVAAVFEERADPRNLDAKMISFARVLDGRIRRVLNGRVHTEPAWQG